MILSTRSDLVDHGHEKPFKSKSNAFGRLLLFIWKYFLYICVSKSNNLSKINNF